MPDTLMWSNPRTGFNLLFLKLNFSLVHAAPSNPTSKSSSPKKYFKPKGGCISLFCFTGKKQIFDFLFASQFNTQTLRSHTSLKKNIIIIIPDNPYVTHYKHLQAFPISQGRDMPMVRAASDSKIAAQPTLTCIATVAATDLLPFRWDAVSCHNFKHSCSFWKCPSVALHDAHAGKLMLAACCHGAASSTGRCWSSCHCLEELC